jgi:hypothetical protein
MPWLKSVASVLANLLKAAFFTTSPSIGHHIVRNNTNVGGNVVDRHAEILGLLGRENGEFHSDMLEVQARNLLIQFLR